MTPSLRKSFVEYFDEVPYFENPLIFFSKDPSLGGPVGKLQIIPDIPCENGDYPEDQSSHFYVGEIRKYDGCEKSSPVSTLMQFKGSQKLTEYDLQADNGVLDILESQPNYSLYIPDSTVKQQIDLNVYYRPIAQLSSICMSRQSGIYSQADFLESAKELNELRMTVNSYDWNAVLRFQTADDFFGPIRQMEIILVVLLIVGPFFVPVIACVVE